MSQDRILLKREELYELVWSTPMLQLAKRYGLSDRGLAKICTKLEIPLPGVGYWAKVAAGKSVERTPLKTLSAAGSAQYEIQGIDMAPSHPAPEVQTTLANLHPLVLQTQSALANIKIGPATEFLINRDQPHLDIRVRPEVLDRALRIMQAIVAEMEASGHELKNEKSHDGFKTLVSVDKDQVSIRLSERVGRHFEKGPGGEYLSPLFLSTGELELSIDNKHGIRKSWRDTKKRPLETALGEFLGTLKALADERRAAREMREEHERNLARAEQERAAQKKMTREKRKFLEVVETQARYWQRAESIRAYLDAFEQALDSGKLEAGDSEQMKVWIKTGRDLSDELDPLTSKWFDDPPEFGEDESDGGNYYDPPRDTPAYAPWWFVKHAKGWK